MSPRLLLASDLQLHFKRASVNEEVTKIVSGWFEDGAPLGLTLEMFRHVLALNEQADSFFREFDTDSNQKVDAFEVLSAYAILAGGTIDEKSEILFPIFDFAGNDRLNFDEINILVHSVCRGVRKVCNTGTVNDNDVIDVCRRLFDSHNLPYDREISKEQVRRWLRSDVEAASFFDIFHNSLALPDVEAALAQRKESHSAVFSQLCGSLGSITVPPQELIRSHNFRQSIGDQSDEVCQELVDSMGDAPIVSDVFARALRAWSVFDVLDSLAEVKLDVKELPNLMHLQYRQPPTDKAVEEFRGQLGLNLQGHITRTAWIKASLCS